MMRTTHGAVMSPRMERLWRYIKIERKIQLHDHSTDQCIERVFPQLEKALAAIPDDGAVDSEELRRDLQCLMRRRPSARVSR